ncbi:MAG: CoA-binding protein, partial [Deltaproteobacteria bacterium]|nr:CoA-binding protein [Deltaproteobacteria bacterium]
MASCNQLNALISPKSVAVIGASPTPGSVGRAVFSNILLNGYQGIVYPINPSRKSILGVRCYPSILEVKDEIDLAVIIVRSDLVPQTLEQCGQAGVKCAVVITAGFKEIGSKGAALEQEVVKAAKKNNICLIGPNCLGIFNTAQSVSLNATFAKGMTKNGNIAFISQSGALGIAAIEYARAEGIGLSKFFSVGNKADITENELLLLLKDDPETKVILLYLEDIANHRDFIDIAREITGEQRFPKPILAIKSGRTREGAKAVSSHTGSLAGSDTAYESVFEQSGVIRVETMEELFNNAIA